jgi:uncharacterized tellurite resistance protein B-like protein
MGWKGKLKALQAAERRGQRLEEKRHRELQSRLKQANRLSELEQARLTVDSFENTIALLLSIHKEQGELYDWQQIKNTPPPAFPDRLNRHEREAAARLASMPEISSPERSNQREVSATANLNAYQPGLIEKLLGKAKQERFRLESELAVAKEQDLAEYVQAMEAFNRYQSQRNELERGVVIGRQADEKAYQDTSEEYLRNVAEWETEQVIAEGVLSGDLKTYARVLREVAPFNELSELGSALTFRVHSPKLVEVVVKVNGSTAIPDQIKSLTTTGKLSTKQMPKGRFHEIYQDYVCGCVLRIGREIFALLPLDSIIVTVLTDMFDSRTGHTSEQAILSVAVPWDVLKKLNFNHLDPSDAMEMFLHRGDFKASRKSGAFLPIVPLTPVDLETTPVALAEMGPINPFPERWAEALKRNEIEFGFLRLTANELAQLLKRVPQENYSLPESKALADAAEQFGYALEPDPRYGAGNFWGGREIGVFQPPSGTVRGPSENYLGASALLQLCLLVAAADGAIDRHELDRFRRFIEGHFRFTPDEHQRLVVLESLLARNATSAKVTLGRTAKRLPQDKHILIGQFLVDVASADAVISPKEYKALERIFEALGLSKETLDGLIRNLTPNGNEVVIQEAGKTAGEEILPTVSKTPEVGALNLNMARVAAIAAETQEVIGLLAKVMADDEPITPQVNLPTAGRNTPSESISNLPENAPPIVSTGTPSSRVSLPEMEGLAPKYQPLIERLRASDSWKRAEFDALVREHHQMPLGTFDAINEWADEHLGDFLLEGDDPIIVHRHLLNSPNL